MMMEVVHVLRVKETHRHLRVGCGGLHHRKVWLLLASELLARRRQKQAKLVRNKK